MELLSTLTLPLTSRVNLNKSFHVFELVSLPVKWSFRCLSHGLLCGWNDVIQTKHLTRCVAHYCIACEMVLVIMMLNLVLATVQHSVTNSSQWHKYSLLLRTWSTGSERWHHQPRVTQLEEWPLTSISSGSVLLLCPIECASCPLEAGDLPYMLHPRRCPPNVSLTAWTGTGTLASPSFFCSTFLPLLWALISLDVTHKRVWTK